MILKRSFLLLVLLLFVGAKASFAQTAAINNDDDTPFTFYIPNAFSPNGDGINDEFYGKGESIMEFEMSIFDRSGKLIFYSDDINNHWTGKTNNGIAEKDVYIYIVKIKDNKNLAHKYIGSVTLVK